jgi:4-amino-4-deoxy-L-arabinose transferase-like glycosyltransferase
MAWGYVDQPPLSVALIWLARHMLGESVFAIRVLPAIAAGATVSVTVLLTRELGGERFPQTLAALCARSARWSSWRVTSLAHPSTTCSPGWSSHS